MRRQQADLLDVVDAAYRLEAPDADWLEGLARAAGPHLDEGFGVCAFEYYKPEGALPQIVQRYHLGIPAPLSSIYQTVFETMDAEIRLRPFRLGPCISGSELMGMRERFREEPHMKRFVQRFGMGDSIWITAAEPSGRGCGFHAGRPNITWVTPAQRERWERIAAHLSAAVRLRRTLRESRSQPAPEAILQPNGKISDANGAASSASAREQLRRAVLALEQSRGPMRTADPDRSLATRQALIAGRWSLVDQLELNGSRYIVARQNAPTAAGPEALTSREKQIVGYAKLGHHNKLIAYELGISASTVRVLISRAARKCRVRTRDELVRCYDDGWGPLSDEITFSAKPLELGTPDRAL
jgi:DNA-binding CsgD family transcriptional regulator